MSNGAVLKAALMTIDPAAAELVSIFLALVFGASGAMKLWDLEVFHGSVANYALLPRSFEQPFAYTLPIVELASACAMPLANTRPYAAAVALGLLLMFTAAIAINLARGRTGIDCGCFGPALRQELSGWLIVRNLVLALCAAIVLIPGGVRALTWLDAVTIAAGAAALAIMYASMNVAIGNAPKLRALRAS